MKVKVRVVVVAIFCLFVGVISSPASANDIYIAQGATGAANGTSCTDAFGTAFFNASANWGSGGGQIGPGTTVHLCGIVTGNVGANILTFHGSGSSGAPITLFWEAGALLTSPACGNNSGACINTNGNTFLTINGNGTTPSITNTANGSSLANQVNGAAILAEPCNNCIFENLDITNIFIHSASDTTNGSGAGIGVSGSNYQVSGSSFDGMFVCVDDPYQNGDTNLQIHHNTFNNMNWGVHIGNNNTSTLSHVFLHDNHIENMNVWDTSTDSFHHDGLFVVQNNTGASITDVELYNNLADGNPGGNATAWLYVNTAMNGVYIYNNVLVGGPYAIEGGFTGDQNYYILNNTIDCKGGSGTNVGPVNNFTIENNVLNNCYTYWSTHNITGNVSVNFNAYDSENSGSGHAFKWNGSTGGQTLAQYQASTGLDANSVNLANFDWSSYIPQSGSQLIAAATNLDGMDVTKLDSDKSGVVRPSPPAKWDAGAFQSSDSSGSTPNPPTGLSAQVQ